MQDKAKSCALQMQLDEFALRDELKRLRAQIPDNPSLNPILNVAFDLSRRLEAGRVPFDDLKALAGRLMDRACVHRARRLRERIGYTRSGDDAQGLHGLRREDGGRSRFAARRSRNAGRVRAPASF